MLVAILGGWNCGPIEVVIMGRCLIELLPSFFTIGMKSRSERVQSQLGRRHDATQALSQNGYGCHLDSSCTCALMDWKFENGKVEGVNKPTPLLDGCPTGPGSRHLGNPTFKSPQHATTHLTLASQLNKALTYVQKWLNSREIERTIDCNHKWSKATDWTRQWLKSQVIELASNQMHSWLNSQKIERTTKWIQSSKEIECTNDWNHKWLNSQMIELASDQMHKWLKSNWLNSQKIELTKDWTRQWLKSQVIGLVCDWTRKWLNAQVIEIMRDPKQLIEFNIIIVRLTALFDALLH